MDGRTRAAAPRSRTPIMKQPCRTTRRHISAWLDLPRAQRGEVREHARACDGCRRELERTLAELRDRLVGNERRDLMGDPGPVSVRRRINVAQTGNMLSTYGPTPTHLESVAIARGEFAELRNALARLADVQLPQLERKLEAAGVPWSPGRGAPGKGS